MSPVEICLRRGYLFLAACAVVLLLFFPGDAGAQDSTAFVEGFYSYQIGDLASGCGDMTSGSLRWSSHHYRACYSAGWGVVEVGPSEKKLHLWGGVSSGGGDCTVCASNPQFQDLTDCSVRAKVTPLEVGGSVQGCKSGIVGIMGRVQGTDCSCTGYLLALSLNNGGNQCDRRSSLQLLCNDRGQGCNGSEPMTLLAYEDVNIYAGPSGKVDPAEEYVLTLDLLGSTIAGAIWSLEDWKAGNRNPLAEVKVEDDSYSSGTFGLYQGSGASLFDDLVVTVEGGSQEAPSGPLAADIDFDPDRLNSKSRGRYVTCYIELPLDYDPWAIDVSTILLNSSLQAYMSPTDVVDHDEDSVPDRMVKFDRGEVLAVVGAANEPGSSGFALSTPSGGEEEVELEVRGELSDGTEFVGTEAVVVAADEGGSKGRAVLKMPRGPMGIKAKIGFELAADGPVNLCVYDVAGRHLRTLVDDYRRAGSYEVSWDRRTDDGRPVGLGVYFVRLDHRGETSVGKMMLAD